VAGSVSRHTSPHILQMHAHKSQAGSEKNQQSQSALLMRNNSLNTLTACPLLIVLILYNRLYPTGVEPCHWPVLSAQCRIKGHPRVC